MLLKHLWRKEECKCGHEFKARRSDRKVAELGDGISGEVVLFEGRNNFRYVAKLYHHKEKHESNKEYHQRILHEFSVLHGLHNEHIIKVFGYDTTFDGSLRMYMEAESRDMYHILQANGLKVKQGEVLCLWKQLCNGVRYLHEEAGVCHRDIKMQNLVIDMNTGFLKIIDFVTACQVMKDPMTGEQLDHERDSVGLVGSKSYAAPETFSRIHYLGTKADIWSVGIVLYYMIIRKMPWKWAIHTDVVFEEYDDLCRDCCACEWLCKKSQFDRPSMLPEPSLKVLSKILDPDSSSRLRIGEVYNDSWFRDVQSCCEGRSCGFDHRVLAKTA